MAASAMSGVPVPCKISPDNRPGNLRSARHLSFGFVSIDRQGDIDAVQCCYLLLPIHSSDRGLDHQKLAGAGVPLELDAAKAPKRDCLKERGGHRCQCGMSIGRNGAARGGSDVRRPYAELAAGKRTERPL